MVEVRKSSIMHVRLNWQATMRTPVPSRFSEYDKFRSGWRDIVKFTNFDCSQYENIPSESVQSLSFRFQNWLARKKPAGSTKGSWYDIYITIDFTSPHPERTWAPKVGKAPGLWRVTWRRSAHWFANTILYLDIWKEVQLCQWFNEIYKNKPVWCEKRGRSLIRKFKCRIIIGRGPCGFLKPPCPRKSLTHT